MSSTEATNKAPAVPEKKQREIAERGTCITGGAS